MAEKGYRVEYVPLSEIVRWDRNPKLHSEAGLDASLERFGFTEPLVLDEKSGKLVAGHGRLEALQRWKDAGKEPPERIAKKGKEWLVPVVRGIGFKDTNEAEAYLIASNKLVEVGGWDNEGIAAILGSLASVGFEGTGFSEDQATKLLAKFKPEDAVEGVAVMETPAPEAPEKPAVQCPKCKHSFAP